MSGNYFKIKSKCKFQVSCKVEKIYEDSLDSIPSPSPSVEIQIIGGKVCLKCKGKTLLGVVNKLLETKSIIHAIFFKLNTKIQADLTLYSEPDKFCPNFKFIIT